MKVQRISRSLTVALTSIVLLGSTGVAANSNGMQSQGRAHAAKVVRVQQARRTATSKRVQSARTQARKASVLKQRQLEQIKRQRTAQRAAAARQARELKAQLLNRRAQAERQRVSASRKRAAQRTTAPTQDSSILTRIKRARNQHADAAVSKHATERRVREARAQAIRARAAKVKSIAVDRRNHAMRSLGRRYQAAQAQHQSLVERLERYQGGEKSTTQIERAKRIVAERISYLGQLIRAARAQSDA